MDEKQSFELAKKVYVLSEQISNMEKAMDKERGAISGYKIYAGNFNSILEKTKITLKCDPTILGTISHLDPFDANLNSGYLKEFEGIRASLPMLKAALDSFFNFHLPKKEREKLGFHAR